MTDYFAKYMKYKKKYLQMAGRIKNNKEPTIANTNNEEINIAICTHDGRMRCFVDHFFRNILAEKNRDMKNIRFKNCAILHLQIFENKLKLSLVYSGEVKDKKRQYFVSENSSQPKNSSETNNNIIFDTIELDDPNVIQKITGITQNNKNTINIYIIRHGEGRHNLKPTFFVSQKNKNTHVSYYDKKTTKDPVLTDDGELQAFRCSHAFNRIMSNKPLHFKFCSKLHRTFQTLSLATKNINYVGENTIVLPCSHELHFKKDSKNIKTCDEMNKNTLVTAENMSKCKSIDTNKKDDEHCKDRDWSYYNEFRANNKCRNTNMIREVMSIVMSIVM